MPFGGTNSAPQPMQSRAPFLEISVLYLAINYLSEFRHEEWILTHSCQLSVVEWFIYALRCLLAIFNGELSIKFRNDERQRALKCWQMLDGMCTYLLLVCHRQITSTFTHLAGRTATVDEINRCGETAPFYRASFVLGQYWYQALVYASFKRYYEMRSQLNIQKTKLNKLRKDAEVGFCFQITIFNQPLSARNRNYKNLNSDLFRKCNIDLTHLERWIQGRKQFINDILYKWQQENHQHFRVCANSDSRQRCRHLGISPSFKICRILHRFEICLFSVAAANWPLWKPFGTKCLVFSDAVKGSGYQNFAKWTAAILNARNRDVDWIF